MGSISGNCLDASVASLVGGGVEAGLALLAMGENLPPVFYQRRAGGRPQEDSPISNKLTVCTGEPEDQSTAHGLSLESTDSFPRNS